MVFSENFSPKKETHTKESSLDSAVLTKRLVCQTGLRQLDHQKFYLKLAKTRTEAGKSESIISKEQFRLDCSY